MYVEETFGLVQPLFDVLHEGVQLAHAISVAKAPLRLVDERLWHLLIEGHGRPKLLSLLLTLKDTL